MYFQILILEIVKRAKVVDWPPLDCQLFAALRSCSQCCSVLGKKVDRRKEQPTVHGLPSVSGVRMAYSALSVCVQATAVCGCTTHAQHSPQCAPLLDNKWHEKSTWNLPTEMLLSLKLAPCGSLGLDSEKKNEAKLVRLPNSILMIQSLEWHEEPNIGAASGHWPKGSRSPCTTPRWKAAPVSALESARNKVGTFNLEHDLSGFAADSTKQNAWARSANFEFSESLWKFAWKAESSPKSVKMVSTQVT